jgi:hypothetical protein
MVLFPPMIATLTGRHHEAHVTYKQEAPLNFNGLPELETKVAKVIEAKPTNWTWRESEPLDIYESTHTHS